MASQQKQKALNNCLKCESCLQKLFKDIRPEAGSGTRAVSLENTFNLCYHQVVFSGALTIVLHLPACGDTSTLLVYRHESLHVLRTSGAFYE